MLNKLIIENFQSHKFTEIEFSPNITIITGDGNHGKSAIFRAVRKIVRNTPLSDNFVSDWSNTCILTLSCTNGQIVRQVRSVSASDSNIYKVNDDIYASFGTSVPPQVLDLLNTSPIHSFSDNKIDMTFQGQMDTMFLVQGTGLASLRGKVLSTVTGVDRAQKAIQLCATDERSLATKIKTLKEDRGDLFNEVVSYDVVFDLEKHAAQITVQIGLINDLEDFSNKLTGYSNNIQVGVSKAKQLKQTINFLSYDFTINFRSIEKDIAFLGLLRRTYDIIQRGAQLKIIISRYVKYDFDALQVNINILDKLKKLNIISGRMEKLKKLTTVTIPNISDSMMIVVKVRKIKDYLLVAKKMEALRRIISVCGAVQESVEYLAVTQEVFGISGKLNIMAMRNKVLQSAEREATIEAANIQVEIENLQKELGVCPTCGKAFLVLK